MWQLTGATQYDAAVTGEITADTMSTDTALTELVKFDQANGKAISIGSDYLKIKPQGSTLGMDFSADSYFSFNIKPKGDVDLTVKKFNLVYAGYKTGGATMAFAYSLDGFATQDSLGVATLDDKVMTQNMGTLADPIKPGSGSIDGPDSELGKMYISFSTDIEVPAGDSLSIRLYAYGKAGLTVLMKDVILSGETAAIPTGISTINTTKSFKVYPTVASQTIHVEATSRIEAIKIVSIDGRVMRIVAPNAQTHDINVSSFRNGLYLVVVKTATGSGVQKVIVNR
jgi:hypothetical protein